MFNAVKNNGLISKTIFKKKLPASKTSHLLQRIGKYAVRESKLARMKKTCFGPRGKSSATKATQRMTCVIIDLRQFCLQSAGEDAAGGDLCGDHSPRYSVLLEWHGAGEAHELSHCCQSAAGRMS